ncbi:MAG TPA: ROK family transcriptional regulator [Acidimicrobiales bacterium]|nr:ROK family transcriptional regulator [Acidimicrobiales bacterium]
MDRKTSDASPQPKRFSAAPPETTGEREPAARSGLPRASRSLLRDINVSLLIELVRRAGSISRADLARQSQLSAPTVSAIIDQLMKRGIVVETTTAPSSGGRPPVLLTIDPKAGYVVGIKLRGDGLTTVVCDLDAEIVASAERYVPLVGDPVSAIEAIEQETRRVLRDAAVSPSKVLGLGIGLSGVIETSDGVCKFSHLLQWHDVELAEPLRERLGLPVWVENDVNTLAVAEKWAGDALTASDFVTLSVGRGIGLGIVVNRSLYRGAHGASGEFGHMIVEPGGPRCECGRFGCLEAMVGEGALRRRIGERKGHDVSRDELQLLVEMGDSSTLEVVDSAGRKLGLAVANVVTLLNPELLIICGEGTSLGGTFINPIVTAVREQTFADLGRELDIKVQSWGDEAWAVGAATLVLRESFNLPGADDKSSAIWNRSHSALPDSALESSPVRG